MARRRIVPMRGWILDGGTATLDYDPTAATWAESVVLPAADISEADTTTVQREKSDWLLKRIVLWYTIYTESTSDANSNPEAVPVTVRLGVVDDDQTLQKTSANGPLSFDFNEWARILQDQTVMAYRSSALVRDGAALSVDTTPSATDRAFAVPRQVHMMDLRVNLGLREDSSLILGFGPWNGGSHVIATGDDFQLDWKVKILVQKRKGS